MIEKAFKFSQILLTAFDQCCRNFLLRYLRHLQWPAPLTDPIRECEQAGQRGLSFHPFVLQESLGLEIKDAVQMNEDPLLLAWWDKQKGNGYAVGRVIQRDDTIGAHRFAPSGCEIQPCFDGRRRAGVDLRLENWSAQTESG